MTWMPADREQFERWQRILRRALVRLDQLHLSREADEAFWAQIREALVEAGATDREIDRLAGFLVRVVIEGSTPGSEERSERLELLVNHLARTDMTVRIGKDESYIEVDFPSRPKLQ